MLKALLSMSVVGISILSITIGNSLSVADSDHILDNFPYYQNIRDENGVPYQYDFDIDFNWTEFGEPVLPGWVSFLTMIGNAMDAVSNFFEYIFPTYGSNNFSTIFGEVRFLSWIGSMSPSLEWWQWLRLSDVQYESLYNNMTNDERLWLGNLDLDEYDLYYSQTYTILHIAEEGYLGVTNYALETRFTTYERCVVYVASL